MSEQHQFFSVIKSKLEKDNFFSLCFTTDLCAQSIHATLHLNTCGPIKQNNFSWEKILREKKDRKK